MKPKPPTLWERLVRKVTRAPDATPPPPPELLLTKRRIAELEQRLVSIEALDLEIDVTVRRRDVAARRPSYRGVA